MPRHAQLPKPNPPQSDGRTVNTCPGVRFSLAGDVRTSALRDLRARESNALLAIRRILSITYAFLLRQTLSVDFLPREEGSLYPPWAIDLLYLERHAYPSRPRSQSCLRRQKKRTLDSLVPTSPGSEP